jgi:NADH:ubiquinone oxidoreductase subunit 5 (subunit L)/multisubunit Na+/H+ antiporter MnhA subunit
MNNEFLLLTAVLVPILAAFILPVIGKVFSEKLRNLLALASVVVPFLSSAAMLKDVISGKVITLGIVFPMGLNMTFSADCLSVFMAMVSSLISAIIVIYSFGYISHYDNRDEYYLMVVLFLGAMIGISYSSNLILLYIFWEITALTSWRLIGFFRGKDHVLKADKSLLVTVFGALVMLIGFVMIYQETGSFDLSAIGSAAKARPISNIAAALVLIGIISKSATLPFHTWLPDAGVAPSPVTALLHAAVLVKIGVYVFARLYVATFTLDQVWYTVVPIIAAVSAIVSAGAAFIETDLKRIIAYSTISQIGFIFFGLSTGSPIGIAGGLMYILMHGIAKAGLFLTAGIIEQNTGERDITKLGGLIRTMPVTAVSFLICAFSVMGLPPMGGFFSKYMVISGGVASGQTAITFVFLAGALFTIVYLFRVFNLVFLGEPGISQAKEGSRIMLASVVTLAFLSIAGGVLIAYPSELVQVAVNQMMRIAR